MTAILSLIVKSLAGRAYCLLVGLVRWARCLVVGIASAFAGHPRPVWQSARSRRGFALCARLLERTGLYQRELRGKYRTRVHVRRGIQIQLQNGQRCHEYRFGPVGYSGDNTRPREYFTDFVGVRSNISRSLRSRYRLFVLRHELQHEIQRDREGIDDATAEDLGLRYGLEVDANEAASELLRACHKLRRWDPLGSWLYLHGGARWCGAMKSEKAVLVAAVVVVCALVLRHAPGVATFVLPMPMCMYAIDQLHKEFL